MLQLDTYVETFWAAEILSQSSPAWTVYEREHLAIAARINGSVSDGFVGMEWLLTLGNKSAENDGDDLIEHVYDTSK